jgi:hypothetical protein
MWVIRAEQEKAFDDTAFGDFVERQLLHLVGNFGLEADFSAEGLRRVIRAWIADARGWGLTEEVHVETYLELCAEFPQMRRPPLPGPLAQILSWPGRAPGVKLDKLQEELYFGASAPCPSKTA